MKRLYQGKTEMKLEDISQNRKFLEEFIEPDYGLLDKLRVNGALVEIEIEEIKQQKTSYLRNCKLMEYILCKEKCNLLIDALNGTQQTHIVNYIAGNGEFINEFSDDWPLVGKELSIIDANYETLVDLLETPDLVAPLYSVGVINRRQMEYISLKATSYEKNDALLTILRRRSLRDYRVTTQCLHKTKQGHIATVLEQGGVVAKARAVHPSPSVDTDSRETEIVRKFKSVIKSQKPEEMEELNRMLQDNGIRLIAMERSQSIILYIHCISLEELIHLKEIELSGKLSSLVKQLLTKIYAEAKIIYFRTDLISTSVIAQFFISLLEDQYIKCLAYDYMNGTKIRAVKTFNKEKNKIPVQFVPSVLSFKKGDLMKTTKIFDDSFDDEWLRVIHLGTGKLGFVPRKHFVIDYVTHEAHKPNTSTQHQTHFGLNPALNEDQKDLKSETGVNDLPPEVLDMILRKSYKRLMAKEIDSSLSEYKKIYTQLLSVQYYWFRKLTERNFHKLILREQLAFYRKDAKQANVVRANRQFLETTIRTKSLVKQLEVGDCLTKVQATIVSRKKLSMGTIKSLPKTNVIELLHLFRSFDETREAEFIRCLHLTNQKNIARVFDYGGAFVKAEIKLCNEWIRKSSNKLVAERLNDLRSKTKQRLHDVDILISQLKQDGIEILECFLDRRSVAWIWCRTKSSLEKLQTLYIDEELANTITNLSSIPLSSGSIGQLGILRPTVSLDQEQFKRDFAHLVFNIRRVSTFDAHVGEKIAHYVYVIGVTKLRNKIYVFRQLLDDKDCVFVVFNGRFPFLFEKVINVRRLPMDPCDIGSSEKENCIFVLHSAGVWKFTIHDKKLTMTKWLSMENANLFVMSVSRNGQVLVIDKSIRPNSRPEKVRPTVNIYGTDAALLLSIQLPDEIETICHAVELWNGNFIIFHSKSEYYRSDYTLHVSEITRDGKIILYSIRIHLPPLASPLTPRLLIDSSDRVFVPEKSKYRVIPSDSNIDLKCDVDLCACKTFYGDKEKQLIVVPQRGTDAFVFTLIAKPE